MRVAVPLLGVYNGLAVSPASRVPHLTAHIICRRSRGTAKHSCHNELQHNRSFVTSPRSRLQASCCRQAPAVAFASELDEPRNASQESLIGRRLRAGTQQTEEEDGGVGTYEVQEVVVADHPAQQTTTALDWMQAWMAERHPETIRFGLRDTVLSRDFIRNADDASFTEAVQLLDAEVLFREYKLIYRNIKPSLTTQPMFRSIRTLEQRFNAFAMDLDQIFRLRREAGHKLTLDACKVVLKTAKVMGDAQRALHVFDAIMPDDGVQPDLECHNLLMEALCWNHAFTKSEWQDLRVTRSRLRARRVRNQSPPLRFSGHQVDFQSEQELDTRSGLRVKILTRFRELVAQGMQGDEATFANVMVAMGREGDLAGVKSVLKSVWNVDVDMLSAYDEEEIESPAFYEDGTPLRPSSRLLFTIVHVFGINNQVGLAFILMDYVSRNYNLPIATDIWFELCNWTRVASHYRTQAQKRKGEAAGQVDWRMFERLWQVMIDEPHKLVPDVALMSLRFANWRRARMLDEAVNSIRDMTARLSQTKEDAVKLFWEMISLVEDSQKIKVEQPLTISFLDKRSEFILASQQYERDLQLVAVATRRLLLDRFWPGSGEQYEWPARRLPTLLAEFAGGAPNRVEYHTPSGFIQFDFEADREAIWSKSRLIRPSNFHDTTWLGIMRKMVDVDDHDIVQSRIKTMLPGGSVRVALEANDYKNLEQAVLATLGSFLG